MDDALAPTLKSALRNLVRSVVVVTAQVDGRPFAMAATAVSEVSMAPPSMLVCINRNAAIFQAIDAGSDLMLNVLSADHEAVSRACGGGVRGGERFAIGHWEDAVEGRPPFLRRLRRHSPEAGQCGRSRQPQGRHRRRPVRHPALGPAAPRLFRRPLCAGGRLT